MSNLLTDGLFVPALALAGMGWLMPKLISLVLPEGVKALIANGLLSTVLMFLLSGLLFAGLYWWQGASFDQFAEFGFGANLVFFGRLGLSSALIWAPIMILSLAGLPRRWTKAVW